MLSIGLFLYGERSTLLCAYHNFNVYFFKSFLIHHIMLSKFGVKIGCCIQIDGIFIVFQMRTWTSLLHMKITASVTITHIKIAVGAIYTCQFFSHTYILLLCWKMKIVVITLFFSNSDYRPLFSDIYYKTILMWGLVSIWLTNATHSL